VLAPDQPVWLLGVEHTPQAQAADSDGTGTDAPPEDQVHYSLCSTVQVGSHVQRAPFIETKQQMHIR
jgi:hypothetical protein